MHPFGGYFLLPLFLDDGQIALLVSAAVRSAFLQCSLQLLNLSVFLFDGPFKLALPLEVGPPLVVVQLIDLLYHF